MKSQNLTQQFKPGRRSAQMSPILHYVTNNTESVNWERISFEVQKILVLIIGQGPDEY